MKMTVFNPRKTALILALGLSLTEQALASANYDSSISVAYTVAVTGGDNPLQGNTDGLSILGTFAQATDAAGYFVSTVGDGMDHAYSPNNASSLITSVFNANFSANGSAGIGVVDSLHTALFGLELVNSGAYSYNLSIQFHYLMTSEAHGEFANSAISLDYWDSDFAVSGFNLLQAASYTGNLDDQQTATDTLTWQYTLAPGASHQWLAQAGISSNLESAQASPVPVPASFWLFGSILLGWFSRTFNKKS